MLLLCKANRMTPQEIAATTDLARAVTDKRLADMVADGQIIKLGRGTYAHPERVPTSPIYSPSDSSETRKTKVYGDV